MKTLGVTPLLTSLLLLATSTPSLANPLPDITQTGSSAACSSPISLNASTNIWKTLTLHPNSIYAAKVSVAAAAITSDAVLKKRAQKVAEYGTFLWLDSYTSTSKVDKAVSDGIPCNHILGLVVQSLPLHTCSSIPMGNDSWSAEESKAYRGVIDHYVKVLKSYPTTAFALIIEPSILPTIITQNLSTCPVLRTFYRSNVAHALSALNLPNVILYIDAAHAGYLGWRENLKPGASEIATAYELANRPSQVRGFSTNLANYNAWDLSPGEWDCPDTCVENPARNEKTYIEMLSRALQPLGVPNHAIMDTSRSAVQGLRYKWQDWCNVNGAGFGVRPMAQTGHELTDAFVWGKPGGESDGTSDVGSVRYVKDCGERDSYVPSPEEGEWNQGYFEMLIKEAKPAIPVE